MNYIQEINNFYDWMETHNPISKNAISLWYALMHVNNKALWAKSFTTSLSTLELKTGIKISEIYKARNELYQCGLINWRQRGSKLSAAYSIYSISHIVAAERAASNADPIGDDFDEMFGGDPDDSDSPDTGQNGNTSGNASNNPSGNESSNSSGTDAVSISKQNETKENKTILNIDEDEESSLSFANDHEEEKSSLSSADDVKERKKNRIDVLKFFKEYNRLCIRLPRAKKITTKRKAHVQARLDEYGAADVLKMLELAGESDFLAGCNKNGWNANFDWLFLPSNFLKVLENQYANNPVTGAPSQQSTNGYPYHQNNRGGIENYLGKPSHLEIIEQTYQALLNDGTFDN